MLDKILKKGVTKIAGNFDKYPDRSKLSLGAEQLIQAAYTDLPSQELWDYHAHIIGIGTGNTGCYMNPELKTWRHPFKHMKYVVYADAAGIETEESSDQQYLERLIQLIEAMEKPWKVCILALDAFYQENSSINKAQTQAFVPNDYIYNICKQYPEYFMPCISIHPYRKYALEELDKWAQLGVKQIKWLPNAMGMDASDRRCDPFYKKLIEYNMVLLTHIGKEESIEARGYSHLGNPLLFRRPLDLGVRVIMAHCGSAGIDRDIDDKRQKLMSTFDLFIRLMDDPYYKGNLFGDISATIQINRAGRPLKEILNRQDLHSRLVNGSDYPLPAINASISTKMLQKQGFIDQEEAGYLDEIYHFNPLLFDFVVKRIIKSPDLKNKFSLSVFVRNKSLGI